MENQILSQVEPVETLAEVAARARSIVDLPLAQIQWGIVLDPLVVRTTVIPDRTLVEILLLEDRQVREEAQTMVDLLVVLEGLPVTVGPAPALADRQVTGARPQEAEVDLLRAQEEEDR